MHARSATMTDLLLIPVVGPKQLIHLVTKCIQRHIPISLEVLHLRHMYLGIWSSRTLVND